MLEDECLCVFGLPGSNNEVGDPTVMSQRSLILILYS